MNFKKWQGAKGEAYVVVQFLLLALLVFGPRKLAVLTWSDGFRVLGQWLALPMVLIGGLMLILGLVHLGKNLSPLPHPKEDAVLIETGIFAWVRHPIYGGILVLSLAWTCLEASTLMLVYSFILLIFFEAKVKREEAQLQQRFASYERYQKSVKKFIPCLY